MAAVRPRRSAAQRASEAITDMADRDIHASPEPTATMSSRARRGDSGGGRNSLGDPRKQQRKTGVSNSSASRRDRSESHDMVRSSRARPTRGPQKRYVESSDDEDAEGDDDDGGDDEEEEEDDDEEDEEEEHDVIRVGDGMDVDTIGEDEDAEGEPDDMAMDVDAEGEADDMGGDEDAEGDLDMDVPTPAKPTPVSAAKAAKAAKTAKAAKPAPRATKAAEAPKSKTASTNKRRSTAGGGSSRKRGRVEDDEDDEDDEEENEELSNADSVVEGEINASVEVAGEEDAEGDEDDEEGAEGDEDDEDDEDDEEDAEGDEDDNDDDEGEGEEDAEGDEDDDDRESTPDLSKMTRRQRARFEETPQEYMKLSDEVQVKKVFTAEELSMRRAEMARRRRNLSDKRNEEVKAETINKLLKRQAPKTTKKNALGEDDEEEGGSSTTTVFIRWTSNQQGSRVGVTDDLLAGPIGESLFGGPSSRARNMVEEV